MSSLRHGMVPALGLCIALASSAAWAQASVLSKAVRTSESMEPALSHPEQDAAAAGSLSASSPRPGSDRTSSGSWSTTWAMATLAPSAAALPSVPRPNMDRLAREGLKLTSTYSQPTCTPTRSAILTGRLPVRTGLTRPILAGDKITKNPWADEISLPKLLSDAGYTTVLSGKWHVGEADGMRPQDIGFDEFYGFYPAEKELSPGLRRAALSRSCPQSGAARHAAATGASDALVHGFKGGTTTDVEKIDSIENDGRGRSPAEGIQRRKDQGTGGR